VAIELAKVHFKIELRPNLRGINEKIFHHLIASGLKIKKLSFSVMSDQCFIQSIYGEFPGGQQYLADELDYIKHQIGPFQFTIDLKEVSYLFTKPMVGNLEELGFRILSQHDYDFNVEYAGSEHEAMSMLRDFLYQL
jgi:hypothetical protein